LFCGYSQIFARYIAIYALITAALLLGALWLSRSEKYRAIGVGVNVALGVLGIILALLYYNEARFGLGSILIIVMSLCFLSAGLSAWLWQKLVELP
jgi:predicted membrane channel-forming protein YqfA (hemolysin III family)